MEKEQIILAAINSIDTSNIKSEDMFEKAVTRRVLTISRFLDENSLPSRIMDAIRIYGKVTKVEFEESSTRWKIYFVADNSEKGEEEMIRTDRRDRCSMSEKMLKSFVGKKVCIYKVNEKSDDKKMKSGYRIAPWVEIAR